MIKFKCDDNRLQHLIVKKLQDNKQELNEISETLNNLHNTVTALNTFVHRNKYYDLDDFNLQAFGLNKLQNEIFYILYYEITNMNRTNDPLESIRDNLACVEYGDLENEIKKMKEVDKIIYSLPKYSKSKKRNSNKRSTSNNIKHQSHV